MSSDPLLRPSDPPTPDVGYEAFGRLARLTDELTAAFPNRRSFWREGRLFFFDPRRQADLDQSRSGGDDAGSPVSWASWDGRLAAELNLLIGSAEARRVARAVPGLLPLVRRLSDRIPAARDLVALLELPEDEVFTVLCPARGLGLRLVTRGVADVGQFQILLAATAPELIWGGPLSVRLVEACASVHPVTTGGVPLLAEARFQLYGVAVLQGREQLPQGWQGCEYWLWPQMPLAAIPRSMGSPGGRCAGERVVLLGPPAVPLTWEVSRRFPALAAEMMPVEILSAEAVEDSLTSLGFRSGRSGCARWRATAACGVAGNDVAGGGEPTPSARELAVPARAA